MSFTFTFHSVSMGGKLRDVSMFRFGPRMGRFRIGHQDFAENESLVIRFMSRTHIGTCLVVQWLRFCIPNTGSLGLIPDRGTRSCMPQLRVLMLQLKEKKTKTKKRSRMLQLRPGTFK